MSALPKAPVTRLIKSVGAERISGDANDLIAEAMVDYGIKLSTRARDLAHHAGRKTIQVSDVKLAMK